MIKEPLNIVPENLLNLWDEEDNIRLWAYKEIAKFEHLQDQNQFIEVYMDCVDMMRKQNTSTKRKTALASLFLRTFDNFGSALRETVSGKYRGCVMYLRDQLETFFLIDYLTSENGKPEKWINASDHEIRENYKPWQIRNALDKRDDRGKSRRAEWYGMLSTLGAHPVPKGLELSRDGTRSLRMGPFKQADSLKQCIEESARICCVLSPVLVNFCKEFPENGDAITSSLSLQIQKISEKYFNSHAPVSDVEVNAS